jgi:thiazole synthase
MAETAEKQTISVRVNGEQRTVESECSIAAMLRAIGLDALKIAVERNLEIVPRSTFEEVKVRDGDAFEIVHFVGGG